MATPPATFTDAQRDHLNKLFDEVAALVQSQWPGAIVQGQIWTNRSEFLRDTGHRAELTISIRPEEA